MSGPTRKYTASDLVDVGLRSYMLRVYNYMCVGLTISAISGFLTIHVPFLRDLVFISRGYHNNIVGLTGIGIILSIAPIMIGWYFLSKQSSLTVEKSKSLFWAYSALTGISLSSFGMVYTGESVTLAILICAALFAGISIYGHVTQRDLSGFGYFLMIGLWGMVLALVVNAFLGSHMIEFISSVIGVILFTGLIAYNTQKIKHYYYASAQREGIEVYSKSALVGAFMLYLDLVNLFAYMMRFLGVRRRDSD